MAYDASNTRDVRQAAKAAKATADLDRGVVFRLMSDPSARDWVRRLLERCHVFQTPFTGLAATTDFNCGEQNIGFQLFQEIVNAAPDQYIQMMREAQEKENGRRSDSNGSNGRSQDDRGDDSGSVVSDYEPGNEDRAD